MQLPRRYQESFEIGDNVGSIRSVNAIVDSRERERGKSFISSTMPTTAEDAKKR